MSRLTDEKEAFSRPTREQVNMKVALEFSKLSTCLKLRTGAVLVKNTRIVSTGYNGVFSGDEHCNSYWKRRYDAGEWPRYSTFWDFIKSPEWGDLHHKWARHHEPHGEINALLYAAAESGVMTKGAEMYSLYSPCADCAKSLITAKIARVYYAHVYKSQEGIEILEAHNIPCVHVHVE
jgi:dCMP deaminase